MRRCVVVSLLVMLWCSIAFAQPKPSLADSLTGDAKAAYQAGKLLFVDGDFAGAEIKFKAAYDESNDPRLLWNMAACEKSLRHYARTDTFVRDYLDKGAALITDQDRADAKALLDLIDSFTVKLTITVSEPDAEVFVDDVSAGKSPLQKPIIVDIGTRKIEARKEGFKPFEQSVPVGGAATAKLDVKLTVLVHEGDVHITAQPGSQILIDGKRVGAGRYDGKVNGGGHTLRIEADGMKPYQTEIVVNPGESRVIDTPPLEKAPEPPKPKLWGPSAVGTFSLGAGSVLHGGGGAAFDMRLEYGWKPGWPTEITFFTDLGTIDPSNNCGMTSYHGPTPTPSVAADLAVRYSFQACYMLRFGFLLGVHFTPRSKFDVYASVEVGTHGVFAPYNAFDPLTQQKSSDLAAQFSLFDLGGRLGVDYHPFLRERPYIKKQSAAARWSVGAFVSVVGSLAAGESNKNNNGGDTNTPNTNHDHGPTESFPWLFLIGARTSLKF